MDFWFHFWILHYSVISSLVAVCRFFFCFFSRTFSYCNYGDDDEEFFFALKVAFFEKHQQASRNIQLLLTRSIWSFFSKYLVQREANSFLSFLVDNLKKKFCSFFYQKIFTFIFFDSCILLLSLALLSR